MPSKTQSNNLGKILCYGAIPQISHLLFDRNKINWRAHVWFCLRLLFLRSSDKVFSNLSCLSWVSEKMCMWEAWDLNVWTFIVICTSICILSYSTVYELLSRFESEHLKLLWCLHEASQASREVWQTSKQYICPLKFHSFLIALVNLLSLQLKTK